MCVISGRRTKNLAEISPSPPARHIAQQYLPRLDLAELLPVRIAALLLVARDDHADRRRVARPLRQLALAGQPPDGDAVTIAVRPPGLEKLSPRCRRHMG